MTTTMKKGKNQTLSDFTALIFITVFVTISVTAADAVFNIYPNPKPVIKTASPKVGCQTIDTNLLKSLGDRFPEVTMMIFFKETSFCRTDFRSGRAPSLCSDAWINLIGFNPYNATGMKHAVVRKTTSRGPLKNFISEETLKELSERYKILPDLESAVYSSVNSCLQDYRMWQEHTFNKKGVPGNHGEYIELLKQSVYNPSEDYYYDRQGGLNNLVNSYLSGDFRHWSDYEKYAKRCE